MSLSSQLQDPNSPIGQFIKQHFSHTAGLTKEADRQLGSTHTVRPEVQGYIYQNIGTTIDYRIRYTFALTPCRKLVAWHGAMQLAFKPFNPAMGVAQGPYSIKLLEAFFDSLERFLNTIQPVRRRLDVESERTLARYCYVLTLFEQVFRAGHEAIQRSPLLVPAPKKSVEALLTIPQEVYVEDICQLSSLFFERCQHLLSLPSILNPTFAGSLDIGGADADLVIDGCLIDIKTSITAKISADYLYQLAGYLLLDYDDRLKMNAAGIYMARQGMLFTWSVPDFLR